MRLFAAVAMAGWLFFPQPPADHRGDVAVAVQFLEPPKVDAACRKLGAEAAQTWRIYGCAGPHIVVLPNPCDWSAFDSYAELACHELGHANGWRHRE